MDIKNIDNNKKRMILIVSVISLLLLLVIGGTIAFFGWRGEEALVSVTVSSGTGSCVNVSDNEVLLYPTADRNNGRIIKLKANQLMGSKAYITWNLVVNKIEGLQNSSFKYELVNSTTGKSYGTGNFANITNTEGSNTITFSNSEEKLDYDTDYEFTLYLWIDGEEFDNPLTMADQEFDFDMSCSITGTSGDTGSNSNNLATHITNLYLNNKDETLVENNDIEYRYASIYDKDDDDTTSGGLMNDRQGTMDVGEDEGNIRYYGANPNNYIYFNCETYPDTNCELWRIIGIVDGKVKIARDSVLSSDMAWDSAGTNNWNTASLKTYLNGDYYAGLKNDVTRGLISMSTWYLGGYSKSSGLYANDIYDYERKNEPGTTILSGNPPSIEANIGLMYASDYGYATDLSVCDKDIYNYDTSANCKDKDWLLKSNGTDTYQWLITPRSSRSDIAWVVRSSGCVNGNRVADASGVRAVLYLKSELAMESEHEGTSTDPYRISLS